VAAKILEREQAGRRFSIVVVAEGACPEGGGYSTTGGEQENREARLGGMGAQVSAEIETRTKKESRVVVLGHLQRGGSPTNFDRTLCTIFGTTAVELVAQGDFGKMVSYTGAQITSVTLKEAVGQLRRVPLDGSFVRAARALGICLGD
jgi:6-phosphofructokinase 1